MCKQEIVFILVRFGDEEMPSLKGFVKQYNQELCISSIARCFTKGLQSRPLKRTIHLLSLNFLMKKTFEHNIFSYRTNMMYVGLIIFLTLIVVTFLHNKTLI